jgi:hypothetical protein
MYCQQYSASDYQKNHREFSCNAAWITIKQDGKVIFSRKADDTGTGEWFDEHHKKVYDALSALETAILNTPNEITR